MGEKEGILQFLLHSLMIRQQPRHVACLECLSLHSEHELLCQEREERDLCGYLCVHTHVRANGVWVYVCIVFVGSVPTGHCKQG